MARSDWTQYGDADAQNSLSTKQAFNGSSSLRVEEYSASNTLNAEILAASESDAPTEARIVQYWYPFDVRAPNLLISRFQDANNYYWAGFHRNDSDTNILWTLGKVVGGTVTPIASEDLGDLSAFTQLSDGTTNLLGQWNGPFRITTWEDSSGDFRARWEEDADGDGTWTQLGNDLIDTSPGLGAGG